MQEDTGVGPQSVEENEPKESIWARIKEGILAKSTEVPQTVVNHYVDKEIDFRVARTISAIDAAQSLTNLIKKIKPDQESFDGDGKIASATFSKAKTEEKKKLRERLEKIEEALADVFKKSDFDRLKKLNLEEVNVPARGSHSGSSAPSE